MPRKNPTEPTVDLTLDGRTFVLFFSFDAIAEAEDATGISLIAGLRQRDVDAPRMTLVRALLWACLLPHQPKITYPEVAKLVTQWNWSEIWETVLKAWVAGMKKPEPTLDPQPDQTLA